MGDALSHFLVNNWFSILASATTLLGAYIGFRERFIKMEQRIEAIEDDKRELEKERAVQTEKITVLQTFQAVQGEKNSTQDQRYAELVIWMRSIDKKLDSLIGGRRDIDAR